MVSFILLIYHTHVVSHQLHDCMAQGTCTESTKGVCVWGGGGVSYPWGI